MRGMWHYQGVWKRILYRGIQDAFEKLDALAQ